MKNFLKNDLKIIDGAIKLASTKLNISTKIVEKDLWVCYVLDFLFNASEYKDYYEFKGGTSLSKVYNLINRFSEDIDIVLNSKVLGLNLEDVKLTDSNNQRNKKAKEFNDKAIIFYKEKLIPELKEYVKTINKDLTITLNEKDLAIYLTYPNNNKDTYIANHVKIEIGPLAAFMPNEVKEISSYVSEALPHLFTNHKFKVRVTKPIRTFFEKIVILHQEAHRVSGNLPSRYFRHYYDVYMLSKKGILNEALSNLDLLDEVRDFTMKFYNRSWSNFETARIGSLRIAPNEKYINELKQDYLNMQVMIYGEIPSFEEIMIRLKEIENIINNKF